MRWSTLVVVAAVLGGCLTGCTDLRDFRGTWRGPRVGEASVVRVGVPPSATATLTIEAIDTHGLTGTFAISGLLPATTFASLPGAEADALAGMTFTGAPLRVYLAFVAMPDTSGEALALIALYDDHRIEARILRGGATPLYAIFALSET